MQRSLVAVLLALWVGPSVQADVKIFEITVSAGARDRTNVPVRVPLSLPPALGKAQSVTLHDADGKSIAAQIAEPSLLAQAPTGDGVPRELHFILPSLKAGASATFKATVRGEPAATADGFSWSDTPGDLTELGFGARPVRRCMCKA